MSDRQTSSKCSYLVSGFPTRTARLSIPSAVVCSGPRMRRRGFTVCAWMFLLALPLMLSFCEVAAVHEADEAALGGCDMPVVPPQIKKCIRGLKSSSYIHGYECFDDERATELRKALRVGEKYGPFIFAGIGYESTWHDRALPKAYFRFTGDEAEEAQWLWPENSILRIFDLREREEPTEEMRYVRYFYNVESNMPLSGERALEVARRTQDYAVQALPLLQKGQDPVDIGVGRVWLYAKRVSPDATGPHYELYVNYPEPVGLREQYEARTRPYYWVKLGLKAKPVLLGGNELVEIPKGAAWREHGEPEVRHIITDTNLWAPKESAR